MDRCSHLLFFSPAFFALFSSQNGFSFSSIVRAGDSSVAYISFSSSLLLTIGLRGLIVFCERACLVGFDRVG